MADLTITFLGTGTSQGVPLIGCECAVCRSVDPRDKRTRSSIYVETPETAFVVDTGTDFRLQCLTHGVRRIDSVVYTHAHADHIMGFDDLRPFNPMHGKLPIYASAETMADLERTFAWAFNGQNRFPGYIHPDPRIIDGPFSLGQTELVPLPVPHGRAKVFGYLLKRNGKRLAAYLSDCKSVPAHVVELIGGVRHLILDGLRHIPHPTHMSVGEALEVARAVQPEQTWLTHLCHDLGHAETEATLPDRVGIAFDGMKLHL